MLFSMTSRVAAFAATATLLCTAASAQVSYSYSTIQVPNAVNGSQPAGINASGTVAGSWNDSTYSQHGFLYANGIATSFDPPGSVQTDVTGIDDAGLVVGIYYDATYHGYAFTYNPKGRGKFTTFAYPSATYTLPVAISGRGVILGLAALPDGTTQAFTYAKGMFTPLIDGANVNPVAIASNGGVAGYIGSYSIPATSFLIRGGKTTTIAPKDGSAAQAYGVNSLGQVVGSYTTPSYVTSCFLFALQHKVTTLLTPPGAASSYCTAANDSGTVVGNWYDSRYNGAGFAYSAGTYTTLSDPDGTQSQVSKINASGVVIGSYFDATYTQQSFIATPSQ